MNKLMIFIIFLSFNNYSNQVKTEIVKEHIKTNNPKENNGFTVTDKDYIVHFSIETKNNQKPNLVIAVELKNGSHFVSSVTKRNFTGKFFMDLGSYTNVTFEGEIIETPKFFKELDPQSAINETVNLVSVNTVFTQPLLLKTKGDFEVFGRVKFVLEPRCTLEEMPFAISYVNAVFKMFSPKC